MKKIVRVGERSVAPLLRALEEHLSKDGFVRSGVVLSRLVEPGVSHMLEIVRAGDGFTINAGVCFNEVLQFAVDAGDEWYLYVGELPVGGRVTSGTCQLIGGITGLARRETDLIWTRDAVRSYDVVASILDLVTQYVVPAFKPLGTRSSFVQKWRDHVLPAPARLAVQQALREQRPIPDWVEIVRAKISAHPERTGLTFWGTPAVNAAIVASKLGQLEMARSALAGEIEVYRNELPLHVGHLQKVYARLGL